VASLLNSTKHLKNTILQKLFLKIKEDGILPNSFYQDSYSWDSKGKENYRPIFFFGIVDGTQGLEHARRVLYHLATIPQPLANILYEYSWKNPQQNISKQNTTAYWEYHILWQSVIYPKNTKLAQPTMSVNIVQILIKDKLYLIISIDAEIASEKNLPNYKQEEIS
jgi:hypothetical protein